jgi:hypothetical protein
MLGLGAISSVPLSAELTVFVSPAPPSPYPAWQETARGIRWQEEDRGVAWQETERVVDWQEPERGLNWQAPAMTILVKRAAEVRQYVMDLSQLPEIAGGDTVASVTTILCTQASQGDATSDLTLSSKATSSSPQGAQCQVAGGVDGITYTLEFTVLTTAGWTLVGVGYLYVDDR